MKSTRPKVLHRLCGRPLIGHVLDSLSELDLARVVVVVGHRSERVTKTLSQVAPPGMLIEYVEQPQQWGTGDAALVALTAFPDDDGDDDGDLVVLPGDAPLLRPSTLAALVEAHRDGDAAATVLTAKVEDPAGYGRVVRDRAGRVARIVEQVDATEPERAIDEINTSIYAFRRGLLAPALRRLQPNNRQGEYYLTDVVAVLHDAGYPVASLMLDDPREAAGVNDRAQLAAAEAALRERINERWMRRGVTMVDPARTYLDITVRLGTDVVLYPGVLLQGSTVVGSGAELGPNTRLTDCAVGDRAVVAESTARDAEIGAGARVGPFVYLAPGAKVEEGQVAEAHWWVPTDPSGR